MVIAISALAVSFLAGFGAGRIKSASKLAAIRAEVAAVEGKAIAEVVAVVAKIKSLL